MQCRSTILIIFKKFLLRFYICLGDSQRKVAYTQQVHNRFKSVLTEKSNTCSLTMISHKYPLAQVKFIACLLPRRQREDSPILFSYAKAVLWFRDCPLTDGCHSSRHPQRPHPPMTIPILSALAAVGELEGPKGGENGRRNIILKFPCKRSSSREPESWSGHKKVPRASLGPWPRSSVHENAHGSSPSSPLSPTDVQDLSTRTHVLIKVISEAETGSDPNGEINMQTTEWKSRCINSLFYSMLLQERQ